MSFLDLFYPIGNIILNSGCKDTQIIGNLQEFDLKTLINFNNW